jgi:hypothetical protein
MKSKLLIYALEHAILHAASLFEINYQIFFIFAFLVVLYMFKLLYLSALRWDLNVDLEFMLVLILHLLLYTLSL